MSDSELDNNSFGRSPQNLHLPKIHESITIGSLVRTPRASDESTRLPEFRDIWLSEEKFGSESRL